MKQKIKVILGTISSLLGALAFIFAANIPRSEWNRGRVIDNSSIIMTFQVVGAVLLIAGILLLVFYFKSRNKA